MTEMELYKLWCEKAVDDPDLQTELKSIEGDEAAIQDRFYRDLEFGTGGLRGVIGAGAYRLNVYTIRRATQGLADYVNGAFENGSVAIAYDSRIKSDKFAKEAAAVLAANGIKVYIYSELMPTPMLSWAVRELKCQAGIVITASHNPAKYNGYKVYGEDGCQITLDVANTVIGKINAVEMFGGAKVVDFEDGIKSGKIEYIKQDVIDKYLDKVAQQGVHTDLVADSGLKVVYTPLNGTGNKPVRAILKKIGIKEVTVVPEQENPDGNFPTCPFPNPEIKEALAKGLELCKTVKPDLLLATDPDCDRVGIAVPDPEGNYVLFSGNEVGAMLLKYICQERTALGTMPKNPVAVKTIVTTDICKKIAAEYNVELREVLTGFKFIGEKIQQFQDTGSHTFLFGFEESYGFLSSTFVRDKDGVNASLLIAEVACACAAQGITLYDYVQSIFREYGYFVEKVVSKTLPGKDGLTRMKEIMKDLRENPPKELCGMKVTAVRDYLKGTRTADGKVEPTGLPKSDVLYFELEKGNWVCVRPSGTEPKIKLYVNTNASDKADAEKLNADLRVASEALLD